MEYDERAEALRIFEGHVELGEAPTADDAILERVGAYDAVVLGWTEADRTHRARFLTGQLEHRRKVETPLSHLPQGAERPPARQFLAIRCHDAAHAERLIGLYKAQQKRR